MPTISISSPTFTIPRSTRPVTTVPRPEIENTSSTGSRNGLSSTRTGSGMYVSSASTSLTIARHAQFALVAFQRLQRRSLDDRGLVARKLVLAQQVAHFHVDQLQQLGVVDHVALVHVHHHVRHADLARQQDVLARLRHRAVRGRAHQDRAVHLRRARDHVLHVVRVSRAIHVRVVPVRAFVFHVRRRDRDPARLFFRRRVDLVVRLELAAKPLRANLRQRRRQRRLAVIHVADRAHVHMRLGAFEFTLGHGLSTCLLILSWCLSCRMSVDRHSALLDHCFGDIRRRFGVVIEFHRERRAALAHRAQAGRVTEHLAERHLRGDRLAGRTVFLALQHAAPARQDRPSRRPCSLPASRLRSS